MLLQQVLNGLSSGVVYALLAAAFSLTFATTRVVNFAFGELFTLGAFLGLGLYKGLAAPYPVAVLGTAGLMVVVGVVTAVWLFGVLRTEVQRSIATIVIGLILRDTMLIAFGSDSQAYGSVYPSGSLAMAGAVLPYSYALLLAAGLSMLCGLWWGLTRTRAGLQMRATAQNMLLAGSLGIPVPRVQVLAISVSSGLLGATAVLVSPVWQVQYAAGGMVAIKAFTAAMLGGLGDVRGAALGGLVLGLVEALVAGYLSTAWRDAAVFVVLATCLLVLPRGILGTSIARVG